MQGVVDTESAQEFMGEVLSKVPATELADIVMRLEVKRIFFQKLLNLEHLGQLTGEEIHQLLHSIFATRRNAASIMENCPPENFRKLAAGLLHGTEKIDTRFQQFCQQFEDLNLGKFAADLAGEMLHFTFPDRYWLWNRWMWDPIAKTGSLPLVVSEGFDLSGTTSGEMYMKVGKAVAFVHQTGEAAGFQKIAPTLFGTDVFLACVYVIYTYTVLRMRMTQEFNKVIPGVVEFSQRLLGVNRMEEFEKTFA